MILRNCLLFILLAITSVATATEPSPVAPRKADTLDPEDIGIGKYVFEATPQAGKVMVLRSITHDTHVQTDSIQETICYTNGAPARQVVLVFDRSRFPFNADPGKPNDVRLRAPGVDYVYVGMRWAGTQTDEHRLQLFLSSDAGRSVSFTYECFVEDYASVKGRVTDLPKAGEKMAWTFNVSPQHSSK